MYAKLSCSVDYSVLGFLYSMFPIDLSDWSIYLFLSQEEEEERSDRWNNFLQRQAETETPKPDEISSEKETKNVTTQDEEEEKLQPTETPKEKTEKEVQVTDNLETSHENGSLEKTVEKDTKTHKVQIWTKIRPSLCHIEQLMSQRVKGLAENGTDNGLGTIRGSLASIDEEKQSEDSDDEFYDAERVDPPNQEVQSGDNGSVNPGLNPVGEEEFSWKEELEVLVRGGLPMALRGEVKICKMALFWLFRVLSL